MKIHLLKPADAENPTSITMIVDRVTWTEIMTEFVGFLRAAGFVIDREMLEEWAAQ